MGNTCAGPNLGNKGFLQSFTAAVWKPKEKNLPSSGNGEDCTNKNEAKSEESADQSASVNPEGGGSEPPAPVQSTPPETVKITGEVSKSVDTTKSVRRETTFAKGEASRRAEAGKQNKPSHVKRMSSVGLQVDSVLRRKTGNMKEVYSLGRKLGQGQFGTTFLCVEKGTGKEFACKTIAKRKLTTEEDVEDVRREIQIMHHLAGHPNVISIVGAYEDAVAVHVIMELCAGGELFDRIIQRGHYSERKAAELARIIVGVVDACHSLGVMHRDLKPENFLFINQEEESPLKTIDFGLSMFFKPGTIFEVDFLLLESIESKDEDSLVRL